MNETVLKPVVFITTIQPLLVGWVLAIAFFVTLALVAMVSRDRRWYELTCLFITAFVLLAAVSLAITGIFVDVRVVDLEIITMAH